ncbi:hypothetical protein LOZ80_15235 [Paenibacillus sp. HWE-109]|uniref:hypothetical protein n=1 Tax=Paenibacillus sp. HWE-109 TaxID=1306526 RepID=UPI001EDE1517|nr:hypothetical protein [Paenibacillus sp. HWE-109]UKS30213.1 hypothetical protein LOZ80_15235 [Paenibacillus sp. HWE-109]
MESNNNTKSYIKALVKEAAISNQPQDKFTISLDYGDGRLLEAFAKVFGLKKTVFARELLFTALKDVNDELLPEISLSAIKFYEFINSTESMDKFNPEDYFIINNEGVHPKEVI